MDANKKRVSVEDKVLHLSNLQKVLYPDANFTKGQVVNYYSEISKVLLPHLESRCITTRRWPDGVNKKSFWQKNCPKFRPEWLDVAIGPSNTNEELFYCVVNSKPSLIWLANLAAIELHTPMAHSYSLDEPEMIVFDLDPGEGAGLHKCAEVAVEICRVLSNLDLVSISKTSGSKGLQVYLPLNSDSGLTHKQSSNFALAISRMVMNSLSEKLVTVEMAKEKRVGKVFIDWSQNSRHKTTIAPYSLRGLSKPYVSTPLTWEEVNDLQDGTYFVAEEVIERVNLYGDLFDKAYSCVQELPNS